MISLGGVLSRVPVLQIPETPAWANAQKIDWARIAGFYERDGVEIEFSGATWVDEPVRALLIMPPAWAVAIRGVLTRRFVWEMSMYDRVVISDGEIKEVSMHGVNMNSVRMTCELIPCQSVRVCIFHDGVLDRYVILGKRDVWT